MKAEQVLNLDQYQLQKLDTDFGHYVRLSSGAALDEVRIDAALQVLAEKVGEFISEQGYKPSGKSKVIIKVPGVRADPIAPCSTVAGTVECKLTATKDQYVLYASKVIDELKGECKRQIEKTWKDRLDELLNSLFDEKYPWLEYEEKEEYVGEFIKQKEKFLAKIDKLVGEFEVPALE